MTNPSFDVKLRGKKWRTKNQLYITEIKIESIELYMILYEYLFIENNTILYDHMNNIRYIIVKIKL